MKKNINDDLRDLKLRLVSIPMMVYSHRGEFDKDLFIWTRDRTENFALSGTQDNVLKEFMDQFKDDKDIETFLSRYNSMIKRKDPSLHFKKMQMSITDSNLMNFEILDSGFLSKILDIKFQVNAFNEEVEFVNEYMKMTFDSSVTEINHQIISREIDNKGLFIAEKAKLIVDKIDKIIF